MDELLDYAPSGFLTLSKDGTILSLNKTLLGLLGYEIEELKNANIRVILSNPSRAFFQLYFVPIITVQKRADEMYLSLKSKNGDEIPILLNASFGKTKEKELITCVMIPVKRRDEYENKLLIAKKQAEDALRERNKVNQQLKSTLRTLETKQEELLEVNKQNQQYKLDTQRELSLAKKIQEASLTDDISNDQIEITSYYQASSILSGDIFGFYQISKHQYGIILLDVMGHGISSALITMSLQSLFQRLISRGIPPDVVMKELDNYLHHLFTNFEDTWPYCTAVYLFIDTESKTIDYINAGHPSPIYQLPSGDYQELKSTTPPIGTFEGITFKATQLSYTKGGKLLLFTDGISEPIEVDRLCSILMENSSSSLDEIKEQILFSLEKHGEEYRKSDDRCFILIDLK